jgi:hypothetical protein
VWEDICDPLHHESIEDLMFYHINQKKHFTRKKMDLANIGEDLFCKKKKVFEPAKSKDVAKIWVVHQPKHRSSMAQTLRIIPRPCGEVQHLMFGAQCDVVEMAAGYGLNLHSLRMRGWNGDGKELW